jgi:hypothetical protein
MSGVSVHVESKIKNLTAAAAHDIEHTKSAGKSITPAEGWQGAANAIREFSARGHGSS